MPWIVGALIVSIIAGIVLMLGIVTPGLLMRSVFDERAVESGVAQTLEGFYRSGAVGAVACPPDQPAVPQLRLHSQHRWATQDCHCRDEERKVFTRWGSHADGAGEMRSTGSAERGKIGYVNEHDVRPLAESEFRKAHTLFASTLHLAPATDEYWARISGRFEHGRVFGAYVGEELAGTAMSMPNVLAIPGGASVPAAAVTGVGVRPDRTRQGVLTELMRVQLNDIRDRGEPVAMLHASEAVIYGRFGYGMASRVRQVSLSRMRAQLRPDAPRGGRVRLLDLDSAEKGLPEIYRRIGLSRPGMIDRSDAWWGSAMAMASSRAVAAVHSDADGVDDGFALYEAKMKDYLFDEGTCLMQVSDMQAADTTAAVELWRFLFDVDMVTEVAVVNRPVDEPLEWWLVDRRVCRITSIDDDLWVRLVDVPAALRARGFGAADPVVIEIQDEFLPENSGTYRVGQDGIHSTSDKPQLTMGVESLGSLYLGDVSASVLAAANRIQVYCPDAVTAADRLFASDEIPWCGTGF